MSISYQQASNFSHMFQNMPKRHPLNKELTLSYENHYRQAPVNVSRGPMIVEYMDGLIQTYKNQKAQYPKVFAVMITLYFPADWSEIERVQADYFSRFMASLRAQIDSHTQRRRLQGDGRTNQVRFCRVVEDGSQRGLHIHAVLFFNGHAFRALGDYDSTQMNLYHRIVAAWGSALGLYPCVIAEQGLIDFSHGGYFIEPGQALRETVKSMFYHYSYLCKAQTKRFDLPLKTMSRSRS
ncbi:MAG: inovirus-type Gp2 protein [Hydrogenovibrio sp.]|uniref:YagK/YfjJ domain-containing protein n=1 Tax=Hydrogenovibrio sp. TaxID=2065821 RepID=UPI00287083AF|nr:inovirus-type Gp2 protein [Hydrogenovibrio sp.]MDR9499950.1 inovirus-type Gp2 protein [Hydrogenovibrio sp.]